MPAAGWARSLACTANAAAHLGKGQLSLQASDGGLPPAGQRGVDDAIEPHVAVAAGDALGLREARACRRPGQGLRVGLHCLQLHRECQPST